MPISQNETASSSMSIEPSAPFMKADRSLYETPVSGVFITRDGELRREIMADETIRPLNSLAADLQHFPPGNRELLVGNIPMRVLSGTGESPLADSLGLSKETADTLRLLGEVIAVFSTVGAVAVAVIRAMEWLGFLGEEKNPYDELYNKIENA